jgi:predicted lipid-binding transport protein (Tim44 family)
MSLPTTSPLPSDAPTSVFVDESGRRRARTRILARTIVAGALLYVLIVIAGLTGSVSFPGVHLGVLGHVATGRAQASRLGPRSKAVPLPSELRPKASSAKRTPAARPSTSATAPAPGASTATNPTQSTPSTGNQTATTAGPASPTTTTTPLVTTTTRAHGRPTSTTHGPPSTNPGVGKGRATP